MKFMEDEDMSKNAMGYRLLLSTTEKGKTEIIITQDIFPTVEMAKEAVDSVCDDLSKQFKNVKYGDLIITDIPRMREDETEYVGHIDGKFKGGELFIEIIINTVDNDDLQIKDNDNEISINNGIFYEISIKGLGEFKFMFSDKSADEDSQGKYFMEVFWYPDGLYGLVDLFDNKYTDDIEAEMNNLDMDYYIDSARVACKCQIRAGFDVMGVYEKILNSYFGEEYEEVTENE